MWKQLICGLTCLGLLVPSPAWAAPRCRNRCIAVQQVQVQAVQQVVVPQKIVATTQYPVTSYATPITQPESYYQVQADYRDRNVIAAIIQETLRQMQQQPAPPAPQQIRYEQTQVPAPAPQPVTVPQPVTAPCANCTCQKAEAPVPAPVPAPQPENPCANCHCVPNTPVPTPAPQPAPQPPAPAPQPTPAPPQPNPPAVPPQPNPPAQPTLTDDQLNAAVAKIFTDATNGRTSCVTCHGPTKQTAGLQLMAPTAGGGLALVDLAKDKRLAVYSKADRGLMPPEVLKTNPPDMAKAVSNDGVEILFEWYNRKK